MSSEERIVVFPASGVNAGVVNALDAIARGMIAERFPPGFFKGGVHVDTRTGIRDLFKNERQATSGVQDKVENISKMEKPRLLVTYRWTTLDTKNSGLSQNPLSQYPNTHMLRLDMIGYEQFFQDENAIKLYTSNLRIRIEFDIILDTRTRDDQVSATNMLYNILKFQGAQPAEHVTTRFVMPNMLIYSLYKILYGDSVTPELANSFAAHMENNSAGNIKRVFHNGEADRNYYVMNRKYNKIYLQFTSEPEMSDPESKNKIYDKFAITFSGFLEMYVPNAYIVRTPDLVKNTVVEPYLFVSHETDDNANAPVQFFSRINDSKRRKNCPIVGPEWLTVVDEDFFMDDAAEDISDYFGIFPPEHQRLINLMTPQERDKIYRVDFYRDGDWLDPGIFVERMVDPDQHFVFKLKTLKADKTYQILAYADRDFLIEFALKHPLPPTP